MEVLVKIPEDVSAEVKDFKVSVSGKKGKLEKDFSSPLFDKFVKIEKGDSVIKVSSESMKRKIKSQVGGIAAHIRNMVKGVTEGYSSKLKVVYLHFPMSVKVVGKEVVVSNFLGEKAPRRATILGDTKVEVKGEEITVSGTDKNDVGQTAANLERATKIAARDRRVFQDGIFVVEKVK